MAKTNNEQTLGQTLAFRRAIEITDAAMSSVSSSGNRTKIIPYIHGMRTQHSYDTSKEQGDANKGNGEKVGNLSVVENAKLNMDDDTLVINFSITILPIHIEPEMANDNEQKKLIIEKNKLLIEDEETMAFISDCYAYKIINASWAWRNRDIASNIKTSVKINNDGILSNENIEQMPIHPILTNTQKEFGDKEPLEQHKDKICKLSNLIKDALTGKSSPLSLSIQGEFKMTKGATVYPSQLFEPIIDKIGGSKIGKKLYVVPFNIPNIVAIDKSDHTKSPRYSNNNAQVGITAEKINNALRKFDLVTDEDGEQFIISFDPNGSDISAKKAFRSARNKSNLIFLYKKLLYSDFNELLQDEKIFLVASLVRGGLFQEAKVAKTKKDN